MHNRFSLFVLLLVFWSSVQGLYGQKLVSTTYIGARTKTQLQTQFSLPFIQYGCKYYAVKYTTFDVKGKVDTASGLLTIPDDATKVYPRLVYQHGTSGSRNDVPSINVKSGGEGTVTWLLAGMGYITLAPDYLGLGSSRGYHPYVHAASEAWAALDLIRAVDTFSLQNGGIFNNQLFITGYSQGGHASMALHRAIENDPNIEFKVTAASHLSGPYSIGEVMRELILTDKVYFFPAYIPNTVLGYNEVYGIYKNISDFFRAPYAAEIEKLYKNQTGVSALNTKLITMLTQNEGSCRPIKLIKDSIINLMKTQLDHPINLALKDNNTYNKWTPKAPMRIFYCTADDQVPFMNSIVARDTLTAKGAPDFAVVDVLSTGDHGACYTPAMTNTLLFFAGFQQVTVDTETPLTENLQINLSPNPVSDALYVRDLNTAGRLEILNAEGRVVSNMTLAAGDHELNVSELKSGFYLVVFQPQGGGQVLTKVIAKQ
jgi:hypothetical protein